MECRVESNTLIKGEIQITNEMRTYIFYPNKEGLLSKIAIISPVSDPQKFYSTLKPDVIPGVAELNLKLDENLYDSMVKEFQELESLMALELNMKNIKWDSPKYELLFDTEEEARNAGIISWHAEEENKEYLVETSKETLEDLIKRKHMLGAIIIPLSFYREGMREAYAKKYINAFFDFYFILEGMYGGGKTKNYEVENQFKASNRLREITQIVINDRINNNPQQHQKITEMLKRRGKTLLVDSLLELIVRTRGELHHFTNNPNKPQGTPFTHKEFRSIASVTGALALFTILFKVVDINTGKS
jgi:hypothetical protein